MNAETKKRVLEDLLVRLNVVRKEGGTFHGRRQSYRSGNVFGGQIISQALSAGYQTVPEDRSVHSLHAYFTLPADVNTPLTYVVDQLRDGASFNTRRITALQNDLTVFSMLTSFQIEEQGLDHQDEMPDVPGPEECSNFLSDSEKKMLENIPPKLRERILNKNPIEIRHIHPKGHSKSPGSTTERMIWFRAVHPMSMDKTVHRLMLAYASDYSLVATPLYRHGYSFWDHGMQVASLDHAIWFHRDFRMDEWLLFAIHSPTACKARGLSLAHIFNRKGVMVATVAQEGLMRFTNKSS